MKISFIGGGNMARALIVGLLQQGFNATSLSVVEQDADKCRQLQDEFGIATSSQLAAAGGADIVVLAVKPQQLRDVAIFLGGLLDHRQIVLSIAAGIRLADLARWLSPWHGLLVRAMPNTPARIRAGITGLCAYNFPPGQPMTDSQRDAVNTVAKAAGDVVWVDEEKQMNAVTALSGSGPAYVFYFLEAMQQAGVELGLAPEQALTLGLQTFLGASRLVAESHEEPAALRAQVTSKGGTTEQAILSMETSQVKAGIVRAIHAAAARSAELGELLGKE